MKYSYSNYLEDLKSLKAHLQLTYEGLSFLPEVSTGPQIRHAFMGYIKQQSQPMPAHENGNFYSILTFLTQFMGYTHQSQPALKHEDGIFYSVPNILAQFTYCHIDRSVPSQIQDCSEIYEIYETLYKSDILITNLMDTAALLLMKNEDIIYFSNSQLNFHASAGRCVLLYNPYTQKFEFDFIIFNLRAHNHVSSAVNKHLLFKLIPHELAHYVIMHTLLPHHNNIVLAQDPSCIYSPYNNQKEQKKFHYAVLSSINNLQCFYDQNYCNKEIQLQNSNALPQTFCSLSKQYYHEVGIDTIYYSAKDFAERAQDADTGHAFANSLMTGETLYNLLCRGDVYKSKDIAHEIIVRPYEIINAFSDRVIPNWELPFMQPLVRYINTTLTPKYKTFIKTQCSESVQCQQEGAVLLICTGECSTKASPDLHSEL